MAQASYPHADSPMGEPEWRKAARLFVGTGVDDSVAGELAPSADGTVLETAVAAGRGYVDGFLFELDAATSVAHAAADAADDRIDLVVVRYDPDGSGTTGQGSARLAVVTGTPAASPARPAPTEDPTGIFELELAEVLVTASGSTIAAGDVTDRRTFIGSVRDKAGTTAERDLYDAEVGDYWWDTDAHSLSRYNGTEWQSVAPSPVDQHAIDAAQNVRLWQLEAGLLGATEGMAGWQGEAFLTGQDEVASIAGDVTVSRASTLRGGSLKLANMPAIGEPYMGGFFAGIIDTTRDNIIGTDAYQSGERYALIVGPKSLEAGRDTGTGDLTWHSSGSQSPAGAKTRWDGLSATAALSGSAYEAADYCRNLSAPDDGGSDWYLPAIDELELVWRNLKPNTNDNYTTDGTGHDFPDDPLIQGVNPSSDPDGDAYTTGDPAQTDVTDFQDSGDEAMSSSHSYWTSTWASSSTAWRQDFSNGGQGVATQTSDFSRVRPVRRVVL